MGEKSKIVLEFNLGMFAMIIFLILSISMLTLGLICLQQGKIVDAEPVITLAVLSTVAILYMAIHLNRAENKLLELFDL